MLVRVLPACPMLALEIVQPLEESAAARALRSQSIQTQIARCPRVGAFLAVPLLMASKTYIPADVNPNLLLFLLYQLSKKATHVQESNAHYIQCNFMLSVSNDESSVSEHKIAFLQGVHTSFSKPASFLVDKYKGRLCGYLSRNIHVNDFPYRSILSSFAVWPACSQSLCRL